MRIKKDPATLQSYLEDSSNLQGGHAALVAIPESEKEAQAFLREAFAQRMPVTLSGAGTGVVGGRIPQGGWVLSTEGMNRILKVERPAGQSGGRVIVEPGVRLAELEKALEGYGLFYPVDPTEKNAFIGSTVSTNASGARSYKYGPTRNFVRALRMALVDGRVLVLRRGEYSVSSHKTMRLPVEEGPAVQFTLPNYVSPQVKNAAGYYVRSSMDPIDLFIGQEGTLGFITEIELRLQEAPSLRLGGLAFFADSNRALGFVRDLKQGGIFLGERDTYALGPCCLEFFDTLSLAFLREKYSQIPPNSRAGVFFEQETSEQELDRHLEGYSRLLERQGVDLETSCWVSADLEKDQTLCEIRHQLPLFINEMIRENRQQKLGTDLAVPDNKSLVMWDFYQEGLKETGIPYCIFGHIGENHLHVNFLARSASEYRQARELCYKFAKKAVSLGGTVSAEHGIGKIRHDLLGLLYSRKAIGEMMAFKKAWDPYFLLSPGNIFPLSSSQNPSL